MNLTSATKSHTFLSYTRITIGLFTYVFGWSVFLIPSKIVGGGTSGISSIIYFLTGFPVGIANLLMNLVLLSVAIKLLGKQSVISSIYGILVTSGLFVLLQQVLHIDQLISVSNFDPFMCCLIGGALSGVGIGLAMTRGGNSGGIDIVALIINKYYNISPGRVILIADILIIGSSWFISYSIENIVYGYIYMCLLTFVIDLVIEGNKQSYQIMVFSQHAQEIADQIGKEIKRGITLLDAKGWYTGSNITVLLIIAHKADRQKILHLIKAKDQQAFISVAKVQGVFGRNFDTIKK